MASAPLKIATPTLAVELEPPATGAAGRVESPSWNLMRETGRPRMSAEIWVKAVQAPVPRSWVALETKARPSGRRRTRAEAGNMLPG